MKNHDWGLVAAIGIVVLSLLKMAWDDRQRTDEIIDRAHHQPTVGNRPEPAADGSAGGYWDPSVHS